MSQSPATIRLRGTRYVFEIESTPANPEWWFELRAVHCASGRRSVINTVNAVIAELLSDEQDSTDPHWAETLWGVSPDECAQLVQTAYEMLTDKRRLAHIESALDEDRAEGEWASSLALA